MPGHDQVPACPAPFSLELFRQGLERRRSRPLRLIPARTAPDCSGLWTGTTDADCIFYAQDTTPLHQWHIVGHEAGHMLFGHKGTPVDGDEFTRLMFPNLDPALVRLTLARSACTGTEEQEAETFASLLLERIRFPPRAPGLPPAQATLLSRAEAAFTLAPPGTGT
jgi:hypothetical protein